MSIRVDGLTIPDFRNTEEALAWGAQQRAESRELVWSVYKALEKIALNESRDMQRKINYACAAQFVREAWEEIPVAASLRDAPGCGLAENASHRDAATAEAA